MDPAPHAIDLAFERLSELCQLDPRRRADYARAEAEFGTPCPENEHDAALWRRRLDEWFVFERVGGDASAPPFVDLLEAAGTSPQDPLRAAAAALRGSLVSLFEVTGIEPGRGLWLHDLAGLGEYPADEGATAGAFRRGDLIAGRIYPLPDGSWHISRAAAFYRNEQLVSALRHDLEQARAARRGPVRISQSELERMFFAAGPAPSADPVGEARELLRSAGVETDEIEEILARLADEPFDRAHLLPGAADALGEVLDRLAFESSIDLDAARTTLIEAWSVLARRGLPGTVRGGELAPHGPPAPGAAQGTRSTLRKLAAPEAVAEFERRRREGMALEAAFRELERDLDLDPEQDSDDEGERSPAPDFPGVVAAVVEEYLWEMTTQRGAALDAGLESVRLFGRFGADIGVFENLGERELAAYLCHWLPESGALPTADAAREHLVAFAAFCRWVEDAQGVDLTTPLRTRLREVTTHLPRVLEANQRRTRGADPAEGELYELLELRDGSAARVRDRSGDELQVELDAELARWLRPGDHLRASRSDAGRLAVYCCYPPEARVLLGGR